MRLCNLHPVGPPHVGEADVPARGAYANTCFEASWSVGPDPAPYLVEKVARLTYVLRERLEAGGTITANFYVAKGKVTDSWLALGGMKDARTALNDLSHLMPPGVYEADRIRLDEVRSVEFWGVGKVVRDPKTISHITQLISASKPTSADDVGVQDVGGYDLLLTHSNGAVTDIRFESPVRGGQVLARVVHPACLDGTYLKPAPGLERYLDERLH